MSYKIRGSKGAKNLASLRRGWIAPFVVIFKYIFFKHSINAYRRVPF